MSVVVCVSLTLTMCVCLFGVWLVVVSVLRTQGPASVAVAEHFCGAIVNLAANHDANQTALGAAGACEGE